MNPLNCKSHIKRKILMLTIGLSCAGFGLSPAQSQNLPNLLHGQSIAHLVTPQSKISGPFTSGNLSVYLIHGKDTSKFQNFLTLQEALDKKQVVVKETGNVNELAIQNTGTTAVFIQSGDIVKGGRQDRTMQYDMIVPPKSGMLPIKSFCVEHDRWSKRGTEDDSKFKGSNYQLAGKSLKMAAKYSGNQQEVWDMVQKVNATNLTKARVSQAQSAASPSPSSLQLNLENGKVKEASQKYLRDLQNITDKKSDVVGYAFAINGKVNSVDVYGSNALFKKMWPKLINSSATEALTESETGKKYVVPKPSAIQECIDDARTAKAQERPTGAKSKLFMQETKKTVLFETQDAAAAGGWVHRNYMTK